MKILQINNRIPYPLNDGGNIGVYYFIKGYLQQGVELSLMAMNTSRHHADLTLLPDTFNQLNLFEAIDVDTNIRAFDAFVNLFNKKSYNVERFISIDVEKALKKILSENDFDIIQFESIYTAPYLSIAKQYSKAKLVLRLHNIEFLIWERLASQATQALKKWYLKLLTKRLRKFEIQSWSQFDMLLPISQFDYQTVLSSGVKTYCYVMPFGIDIQMNDDDQKIKKTNDIKLYHIGAMDWLPNSEGIKWFLKSVFPKVRQQLPNIQLYLAGRNMPQEMLELEIPGVIIEGEIPDAKEFEKDKDILIVPLQSGSGVRVKIFEAMANGKAVVSTKQGAEGIEINDEIKIAQNADEFASHIIHLAQNPEEICKITEKAQKLVTQKYNSENLFNQLVNLYKTKFNIN